MSHNHMSHTYIHWTMSFKYVIFLKDNTETLNFHNYQIYSFT